MSDDELREYISEFRDDNLFAIAELLYRGATVEEIHEITKITAFFLEAIKRIIDMEQTLKDNAFNLEILKSAKKSSAFFRLQRTFHI
jgi:carbamoyl-phosphate synthase large subunit